MMLMDVTDDAGKVTKWTVEFAGSLTGAVLCRVQSGAVSSLDSVALDR
jgi:hypothetical protein